MINFRMFAEMLDRLLDLRQQPVFILAEHPFQHQMIGNVIAAENRVLQLQRADKDLHFLA